MIKIKRVRALDNYRLECLFENNEIVIYNMAYVLEQDTPMLDPLKNESFFRQVFLESGAPVWKNGYDLCPDSIWERTHLLSPERAFVASPGRNPGSTKGRIIRF
jgi:hypothetical protein